MQVLTHLIVLLISACAWNAAQATNAIFQLRGDGQSVVNVAPGQTFALDVVYSADSPIAGLYFWLDDPSWSGAFTASSVTCNSPWCNVFIDPTPVQLPNVYGDPFYIEDFYGLPEQAVTIQIAVAAYAAPGAYSIALYMPEAYDLMYNPVDIMFMESLIVEVGGSPPVTPPEVSDFEWQAETIAGNLPSGNVSLAFLRGGVPAMAFPTGSYSSGYFLSYAIKGPQGWQTQTVDSARATHCSIKALPGGRPAISYYDDNNDDLKYAWYDGVNWSVATVDSPGSVGTYNSLAILPNGRPAISYYDYTNRDLKYAAFDGSTWQVETVDSAGTVGLYTSLAILPSGEPAISYYDSSNADLKYAWQDAAGWHITIVDSTGTVGSLCSLAILSSGHPAIAYRDHSASAVNYAAWDGSSWAIEPLYSHDYSETPVAISLAILPDGNPAVALSTYRYEALSGPQGLFCIVRNGSVWNLTNVDMGNTGSSSSLLIGPDGRPNIAFSTGYPYSANLARHVPRPPSPVAMSLSYSSYAASDYGASQTVPNGMAQAVGTGCCYLENPRSIATSQVLDQPSGHLRTHVVLRGVEGEDMEMMCLEWDPVTGECLWWDQMPIPLPPDGAEGNVAGSLTVGTSASYPVGTPLRLTGQLIVRGNPCTSCTAASVQLLRDSEPLIDYSGSVADPAPQTVTVYAGETLQFALSGDISSHWSNYEVHVDGRWILARLAPFDFDEDGDVDADDFLVFEACASGPALPYDLQGPPAGCTLTADNEGFLLLDLDRDGDIDHVDFGGFQRCYSGEDKPANPGCLD